jgi:hypothetical protein
MNGSNPRAYGQQLKNDPNFSAAYKTFKDNGVVMTGGAGGTIYWNSSGGVSLKEVGGGRVNRPTVYLGHELFHASDANRGRMNDTPVFGITTNEWQATYRENVMRSQMGIPLRSHYSKTFLAPSNKPFKPLAPNSNYLNPSIF